MANLCPSSSKILTLDDDDILFLRSSQDRRPLCRVVDIHLTCNVSPNSQIRRTRGFEVSNWTIGMTKLCGSCSFCLLLLSGVQHEFDTGSWFWKEITGSYDQDSFRPVDLHICFDKLTYLKDTSPWAVGQESLKTWSVYAISLAGNTYLESNFGDIPVGMNWPKSTLQPDCEVGFEIFAYPDDPISKFLDIHRRPLDTSPLSDGNIANIRRWMRDCDDNHEWCSSSSEGTRASIDFERHFLPSRLVDVGDLITSRDPRLVLSQSLLEAKHGNPRKLHYMALSYCWGSTADSRTLLKSTHSTIDQRLKSIELQSMPLAFQDAVTLARTLNIQYIWIDSLCIIQDDAEDWQIESSRMADIFSNAYLTVIAATGSSCHNSFLFRELNQPTCSVPVHSEILGLRHSQFGLRWRRRLKSTGKMAEIIDSRWITRGWTFQEERLAKRVLMFGRNKFFLDCRTIERAEDTEKYRLRPDWVGSVCGIPPEENGATQASKYSRMRSTSDHWQTLCTHYSYRELTFPADKLPAISGIANKFSKTLDCAYLAGMWKDYLMHDLFWFCISPTRRHEKYRAPSWSWASVDGKISWPFWRTCGANGCEMYCNILEAQTSNHGLDPFGAINDGHLKISGLLLEVNSCKLPNIRATMPQWRLYHEETEIAEASPDLEILAPGQTAKYSALIFAKCKGSKGSKARKNRARGILIEYSGEKKDGHDVFRRVGVFYIASHYDSWCIESGGDAVDLWRTSGEDRIILII